MEQSKKGLIRFLICTVVILVAVIGVLIGIIVKKDNKVDTNNNTEQKEAVKAEKEFEEGTAYYLSLIDENVKRVLTIDNEGKGSYKETKDGRETEIFSFKLTIKALYLLDDYFETFIQEDYGNLLFTKKKYAFYLNLNLDESKEYQNLIERIQRKDTVTSEDEGYDKYITKEAFNRLRDALKDISKGAKDQETTIGLALQEY